MKIIFIFSGLKIEKQVTFILLRLILWASKFEDSRAMDSSLLDLPAMKACDCASSFGIS